VKLRIMEFSVGCFIIAAVAALMVLAFKVSGLSMDTSKSSYAVTADFSNIGDLKVRAPVTVAGVRVGQVVDIQLDKKTYKAVVTMRFLGSQNNLPTDSAASIVTAGLLGANYISITPGFDETYLKAGDQIEDTHPALQLETMIGQLLFNMKKDENGS
jgi:phospholipid/cholesterol/gamma-HCH transport system substrate-binding protein